MTSKLLLHGGHMRLGVNLMYWSNFCVLVWRSLSWVDFISLSYIIRICGHVMDDIIALWWSRESWYDFFLRLGWNSLLGVILLVLVWFYVLVQSTESWYDFSPSWWKFSSWCDFVSLAVILCLGAINWILVWFFFVLLDYFVLLRFCLIWYHLLSWCD